VVIECLRIARNTGIPEKVAAQFKSLAVRSHQHRKRRVTFKLRRIGDRIAMLSSGLAGDAHVVAAGVKKAAPKTVDELLDAIVHPMWEHGARRDLRPLGVGFIVASTLGGDPRLFGVDPSAAYWEMDAGAIGLGHEAATAFLEKRYRRGVAREAETLALGALGTKMRSQVVVIKT